MTTTPPSDPADHQPRPTTYARGWAAAEARFRSQREMAGHRFDEPHDCFLADCDGLGQEVRSLRDRIARSQRDTEPLREAARAVLSLIETANVPRTAAITIARTGTLLDALRDLRAALGEEPDGQ